MILNDYRYGVSDYHDQIPRIKRIIDRNYLKNDWFVNVASKSYVRYYFSYLMIFFAYFLNMEITYLLFFIASLFFIGVGTYKISLHMFNNKITSYLSIFLVFFGIQTILGMNYLIGYELVPCVIAGSISIIGFYFFLRNKYYLACLLAGFATLIHIMVGVETIILFGFYFLFNYRKFGFLNLTKYLVVYLIISGFAIIPLILQEIKSPTHLSGDEVGYILGHIRAPERYLPFQFGTFSYLTFFVFVSLYIISLKHKPNQKIHKTIMIFFLGIFFMCLVGVIFVEIIPIVAVIKMHFFRSLIFFRFFALIYIANYFRKILTTGKTFTNFLNITTLASFHYPYTFVVFVPLTMFFNEFLSKKRFHKLKKKWFFFPLFVVGAAVMFVGGLGFRFLNVYSLKRIIFVIGREGLWFLTVFCIFGISKQKNINYIVVITSSIILFSLFGIYLINNTIHSPDTDRINFYSWIKANTPNDAVFISPPYIEDFRLGADRAIVVDFKGFPFSNLGVIQWEERINDLTNNVEFKSGGNRLEEIKKGYFSLKESDFIRLGGKYNASYVITEKPTNLNFTKVFESEKYSLWIINQ